MKRLIIATGVVLALLLALTIQSVSAQDVMYACVGKKGQLRIVFGPGECKSSETEIWWNQQGSPGPQGEQGPAGAQGPEGPPGAGCLGVYDGSDLFLGYVVDVRAEWLFAFDPDLQKMYEIIPDPSSSTAKINIQSQFNTLYFTSTDCTGIPYTRSEDMPRLGLYEIYQDNGRNYYLVLDKMNSLVHWTETHSQTSLDGGPCIDEGWECPSIGGCPNTVLDPVQFIDFPLGDETLVYPIVVRPMD